MPEMSVIWLRLAVALYAVGLLEAILSLLRKDARMQGFAQGAFQFGAVFHFVAITEHSVALRQLAANNFFETASLCALLFALVYLYVQWRYEFSGLSLVVFPLVSLLAFMGAMGTPVSPWTDPRVRNAWLLTHIVLVLAGFAGLLLSAGASGFYLLQERRLKRRHTAAEDSLLTLLRADRLPPLETLDTLITRAMSIGFAGMTMGVAAGSSWAFVEHGTRWISEPKIVISIATWGVYLLMVFLRISSGWRGRKAAVLSLTVLGFAALTWAAHIGLQPLLER